MAIIAEYDFIFNNDYVFKTRFDLSDDYYSPSGETYASPDRTGTAAAERHSRDGARRLAIRRAGLRQHDFAAVRPRLAIAQRSGCRSTVARRTRPPRG